MSAPTDVIAARPASPNFVGISRPRQTAAERWRLWTKHMFGSPFSALLTLAWLTLFAVLVPRLTAWAAIDATWSGTAADCRAAGGGACWSFLTDNIHVMVFGLYPADQRWRPGLALALVLVLAAISGFRRFWGPRLAFAWSLVAVAMVTLMAGGVLGLRSVPTDQWSGLPVTLMLSLFGLTLALPIGIMLALGRRSRLPVIRVLAVGYIELIRGLPLVCLLFTASILIPLFLPAGVTIDKLLRAQVAVILFAAAYLAEVVRAGLQGVPTGQLEAARSLGFNHWQSLRLIVLPQALRIVVPPLVSTFIDFFKGTTLISIVGLFDFLRTVRVPLSDPGWRGFSTEAYLFAGIVYFCFCFTLSKYSKRLERHDTEAPAAEASPQLMPKLRKRHKSTTHRKSGT